MAETKFTNALLREAVADADAVKELANEVAKITLEEKLTPSFTAMWERKLRAHEEPFEEGEPEGSSDMPADSSDIGNGDNKEPSDDAFDTAETDHSNEAPADSSDDWYEDWSDSDFDLDEVIRELEEGSDVVAEGEGAQKWTEANDGVLAEDEDMEFGEEDEEEGDEEETSDEESDEEEEGEEEEGEGEGEEGEEGEEEEGEEKGEQGVYPVEEPEMNSEPKKFTLDEFVAMMQEAGMDLGALTTATPAAPAVPVAPVAPAPVAPVAEAPEFNLEEVLAMLEAEDAQLEEEDASEQMASEVQALQEELAEYRTAIEFLRGKLTEVNLLNAKLLYTNKLFRKPTLTNEQKVKIVENFDRATTVREVKMVYAVLAETLNAQTGTTPAKRPAKKVVTEGFASKATPSTAPKAPASDDIITEGARRWQQLAGINI